ncbi:MAG: SDR family NAD(P)-dependent oxidoreductase [Thermonemataceae bacterium]
MKNIILTGGSRGIGEAVALQLAANPTHQVYLIARSGEALQRVAAQAYQRYQHRNVFPIIYDLTTPAVGLQEKLPESLTQVDVLINNAGFLVNKPFEQHSEEDWQKTFEVNVFGVVRMIKGLQDKLGKERRSHILNVGSMGGFQGSTKFEGLVAYSASKAALANLTESLAQVFVDKHIAVNCLALGAVQTDMLKTAFPTYQAPLSAEEMAKFVTYFALEGHQFFNGKVIPVALSTP